MECPFDRGAEDLGNIVALEHVNVTVPDQQLATTFYISGLGLTRDPYLMNGVANMWVNVGRSQFHLPGRQPQVVRGRVGLVTPSREALLARLKRIGKYLVDTRFSFEEHENFVDTTCPWGNRIRCHAPNPRFGRITLGMPYVEFDVPSGTADGIARFYRQVMGAPATVEEDHEGRFARVGAGNYQELLFRETDRALEPYDGHHIQVYVADFSGPHRRLAEKGLIFEESDQHQYRFKDIFDLETGKLLYTIEHEVRSMRYPMFMRPLVNRNPMQSNMDYAPGHDAWVSAMPRDPS